MPLGSGAFGHAVLAKNPMVDNLEMESLVDQTGGLHTQHIEEVFTTLGLKDKDKGLDNAIADARMADEDDNCVADAARPCPAWLCCLIPCLNNTTSMVEFRECIPKDALRLMSRRPGSEAELIVIDAQGLVRGDVIHITADVPHCHCYMAHMIPADAVIFECSDDFQMDRSRLRSDLGSIKGSVTSTDEDPVLSGNTALMGTLVTAGWAKAVVFAVGNHTHWSRIKYQTSNSYSKTD